MDHTALLSFCLTQWAADPATQIADAYKWLAQATLGAEHAAGDVAVLRERLAREWAQLAEPAPGEPLSVPLRPDGALLRLNLRPYRRQGGDIEALLAAFHAAAHVAAPDRRLFHAAWQGLGAALAAAPVGDLTAAAWAALDQALAPQGYPAIHHSPRYRAERAPAYRVLQGAGLAAPPALGASR